MKRGGIIMRIAFTGYRPESLPFRLDSYGCHQMEMAFQHIIREKIKEGCNTFYCGAARGIDYVKKKIMRSATKRDCKGNDEREKTLRIKKSLQGFMKAVQPVEQCGIRCPRGNVSGRDIRYLFKRGLLHGHIGSRIYLCC